MEANQKFGPNAVGFNLVTGERRWYIMGCYLTPDDTLKIGSVVSALKERPRGARLLVAGDFKVKLSEPEGKRRGKYIAEALAMEGLKDIQSTSSRSGFRGAQTGRHGACRLQPADRSPSLLECVHPGLKT